MIWINGGILVLLVGSVFLGQAQSLPPVEIFSLDGGMLDASTISNENRPMVVVFFKTSDNKSCDVLYSIYDAHESELRIQGVKLIAVCIDCIGTTAHVRPFVYGRDLQMEVFVDKSGDLKRAMGISNAPFTIMYDQEMKEICRYSGYCSSAGEMVCEKMKQCLKTTYFAN